jgi:serine/threonine protein kinase
MDLLIEDKNKNKNKDKNKDKDKDKDKDKNDGFLGEGSYGCVYYPGIDCKGKKNTKKTVTKLQEINFYSKNEKSIGFYIKKNIKNFKNYFSSIIKACIIKFDIIEKSDLNLKKCNTLFEDYNSSIANVLNYTYDTNTYSNYDYANSNDSKSQVSNQYYLMYSYYIKNKSLKEYYSTSTNYANCVISILNNFSYILASLMLLNKHKIIHNDLHVNNIVINLKTNKPIILDFGLSFLINKCYKLNKNAIDFYTLKKFIFDFRLDHYHINIEKRFICFCVYNTSDEFYSIIDTDDAANLLTKTNIDFFINDSYDSIANNNEISKFFTSYELSEYKKALQQFYYKFYNKTDYPTYTSIVKYLLDFVYAYNDLYSLTIDLLYIYDNNKLLMENSATYENNNFKIMLDFFIQLYKKVLYPDPTMRLKISEVYNIYMFIVNYIKNIDINEETKYNAHFIIAFTKYLKSKSISIEVVFNKKFAFMNFNLLCTKTIFTFVKTNI